MRIVLDNVTKSFVDKTIFSDISFTIEEGDKLAILGGNGSGKSTLLGILSGLIEPTNGDIQYFVGEGNIPSEIIYEHYSLCAPYMSLYDEFSVIELLGFHFGLKECIEDLDVESLAKLLLFKKEQFETPYKFFSSGMKQRLKLGLALLTKSSLVLLDEPLTNLDDSGRQLYNSLLEKYLGGRTLVVASNMKEEYAICSKELKLG